MDGIRSVAPTAALLAFAVVFFGVMNDAGLFEPFIRWIVRLVGDDPLKVVIGTAAIAAIAHLDGAGASTFMITVPAMLPIYARLRMDPLVLTTTIALAAGTMNILPWGGPTSRAAAALEVSVSELFLPLIVPTIAGVAAVFACAWFIGRRERARIAGESPGGERRPERGRGQFDRPRQRSAIGRLWIFNAVLTLVTLVALVLEVLPLPVIFLDRLCRGARRQRPGRARAARAPECPRERGDGDGHDRDRGRRVHRDHDQVRHADRDGA